MLLLGCMTELDSCEDSLSLAISISEIGLIMEAKISCVLPVASYNQQWLKQSLESALGLFDELVAVIEPGTNLGEENQILLEHSSVHVMYCDFPKCEPSLNAGIAACTGNWITFLCSDDMYDRPGTEKLVEYVRNHPGSQQIISGQVRSFREDGIPVCFWPASCPDLSNIENNNCIPAASFYPKRMWYEVGGYDRVTLADWHFWKKSVRLGYGQKHFDHIFYHFRCWPGSTSAAHNYDPSIGHQPYE